MKRGDTIYFSSVATLVNEGTVKEIQGNFIKVETACPGIEWLRSCEAFPTKEELRGSDAYHNAWMEIQRRRHMQRSFTQMASLW